MSAITGKIALITGGASGIGLCYAKELLKNGLKAVTIADLDRAKGEEAVKDLTATFGKDSVLFVKTDVTINEEVKGAFEETIETFKNLDIIINNAGIMDDRIWEKQVDINLNGSIRTCILGIEEYLPKYRTSPEAIIVNISSVTGLGPIGALPIYASTKHAIIGLSRSFGCKEHYDRTKVRILTICPSMTETPLILDGKDRNLGPAYRKLFEEDVAAFQMQKPEAVAKGVVQVINEGESGSVWAVAEGKVIKLKLPDILSLLEM